MTQLDILTIIIFSVVVFVTGISFSRTGKDIKSFFAGGGAVPWGISGLSLFMSFFSAGTFVAWGSIAYSEGFTAVVIQWMMGIAGLFIGFYLAGQWRKKNVITAAEFITKRLGGHIQNFYTYIFLIISMFTSGAFLYPVAKIVEVSTGIPIYLCIIVLGGLIAVYTAIGGLWAVMVTDVLQFIVLTSAVIIVVPLVTDKVDGLQNFLSSAPDHFFNLTAGEYSWWFMLAFAIYNFVFIGGNWAYVQRYTSVSSPSKAKKVGWLFSVLYFISPLIWMIPPMMYRVINPGLTGLETEDAYLLVCKEVLPGGVLGLILGGMIFATSSSVNTTLNISAGVFTNDIYKRLYPRSSDKGDVIVGRISTLIFGALTVGVALIVPLMGGIVEVVFSVAAITGGAMYLPVIWALFSKRQNGFTILCTTLLSLLVNIYFKFISPEIFDFSLNRSEEMLLGMLFPAAMLVLIEFYLARKKVTDPLYEKFESSVKMTNGNPEETKVSNVRGIRIIGISIGCIGVLVTALGLLADFAQFIVVTTGAFVFLLGIIIWIKATKVDKKQELELKSADS